MIAEGEYLAAFVLLFRLAVVFTFGLEHNTMSRLLSISDCTQDFERMHNRRGSIDLVRRQGCFEQSRRSALFLVSRVAFPRSLIRTDAILLLENFPPRRVAPCLEGPHGENLSNRA